MQQFQVVRLYGVCTQGEKLMMVLELLSRGDLKSFLRDCRGTKEAGALLTQRQLMKMAIDVANGMVFLSSLEFVHRDLAARFVSLIGVVDYFTSRLNCSNCLVAADLTVKVADFGLSRDVHYSECLLSIFVIALI